LLLGLAQIMLMVGIIASGVLLGLRVDRFSQR